MSDEDEEEYEFQYASRIWTHGWFTRVSDGKWILRRMVVPAEKAEFKEEVAE